MTTCNIQNACCCHSRCQLFVKTDTFLNVWSFAAFWSCRWCDASLRNSCFWRRVCFAKTLRHQVFRATDEWSYLRNNQCTLCLSDNLMSSLPGTCRHSVLWRHWMSPAILSSAASVLRGLLSLPKLKHLLIDIRGRRGRAFASLTQLRTINGVSLEFESRRAGSIDNREPASMLQSLRVGAAVEAPRGTLLYVTLTRKRHFILSVGVFKMLKMASVQILWKRWVQTSQVRKNISTTSH